ncbi:hypothetical protein [Solidesulfovibrio sp.]
MANLAESITVLLVTFLALAGIIVGIFVACRELVCWYAKVNERLELEKKRNDRLDEISNHLKILIQIELAKKQERDDANEFQLTGEEQSGPGHH